MPQDRIYCAANWMCPIEKNFAPKVIADLLVSLFGFITSLATAVILWLIETHTGHAFYSLTLWHFIPIGAMLSGFAGSSGYFLGSWVFGHRPTKLLLINILLVSATTFFLVFYLPYRTLEINGNPIHSLISFPEYLDVAFRSASIRTIRLSGGTSSVATPLGWTGYIIALLQIIGFSIGGLLAYMKLASKPYCEKCFRYPHSKGKRIYYSDRTDAIQSALPISNAVRIGDIASALDLQKAWGSPECTDHCSDTPGCFKSVIQIYHCPKCKSHNLKFQLEHQTGSSWTEVPQLTTIHITDQVIDF